MAKDKISIKFLIHLVGERPALWDKTCESYKDREMRETSWREICAFVNEDYEQMTGSAKLEFTKMITKKWTSIRDSWIKSMKNGYDEQTKLPPKPYVYHEDLKFLQKILGCGRQRFNSMPSNFSKQQDDKEQTQSDDCNDYQHDLMGVAEVTMDIGSNLGVFKDLPIEDHDDEDDWPAEEEIKPPTSTMDIKRETTQSITHPQINPRPEQKVPHTLAATKSQSYSRAHCANPNIQNNRHWNFFMGIIPSLNMLNDDQTLQFQAGTISLIQKLKASQKQKPKSSTSRKRTYSDDEDTEYEPSVHKVKRTKSYRTRSTRYSTDPIANDGEESRGCSEIENVECI